MKRLIVLCGALALTLAMAAPAAALEKVHIKAESGPWGPFEFPDDIGCVDGSGNPVDVYFGFQGTSDFWLWYKKGVDTTDPAEYMPDGRAWPWVKGQWKETGNFYVSSEAEMKGKVISGKTNDTVHMYAHHLGDPYLDESGDPAWGVPPAPGTDLEWWKIDVTGKTLSFNVPGYGLVGHESGKVTLKLTVLWQNQQPEGDEIMPDEDNAVAKGNFTYHDDKICAYFGYDYVEP